MKRILALLLVCTLITLACFSAEATEPANQDLLLSELSEDQCIEFILSAGLEIPEALSDYTSLGAFVKNVIKTVEDNPHHLFIINIL